MQANMDNSGPDPNMAHVIFHAFDMHCNAVQLLLPRLHTDGYTHIQLSPMQASRTTKPMSDNSRPKDNKVPWWYQYQPTSFTVGNCYGTSDDLKSLALAADKLNIGIIVDVCFNFMAEPDVNLNNEKELFDALDTCYKPFTRQHFKPRKDGRGRNNWFQGQLPCLRLDLPDVQKVHFAYLQELANCGVTGFRFDCGGWFDPKVAMMYYTACVMSFRKASAELSQTLFESLPKPRNLIVYWELTERRNLERVQTFCESVGPALEYMHADKLAHIFATNDLKKLTHFDIELGLLNPDNVTFTVNHDTYNSAQSKLSVKFANPKDAVLATCFLLSIQHGQPLIFCAQADDPFIREAIQFRKHCCSIPSIIIQCSPNVVLVQRKGRGVMALNNSGTEVARLPGRLLQPKSVCFIFCTNNSFSDDIFVTGTQRMLSTESRDDLKISDTNAWPALSKK